ncbi:MAG: PAS domain S-box protein [Burkholderiales bacterium]
MASRFAKPRCTTQGISDQPVQFFQQMADHSPHMLWAARPDGMVEFVNARVCEYAGRSREQLEDSGWRSLVHPDDWERCLARWVKAHKKGHPYEVEYRLRRHDGRYFWHLGAAMPHREGGRIVRWFGSSTEIENQKRAEHLLNRARDSIQALVRSRAQSKAARASELGPRSRELEERLRSIMTLWSDFYWETDTQHRFTVLEIGGRFKLLNLVATRIGKTRWEVPSVLPDEAGWRAHRAVLEARLPFRDFETARRGDDGELRHYSIDGEPVFGEKGEFLGYRGVGREITERKRAEQALLESERQLRRFLDSMPGVAWIKDSKMRYVWVSASYERILGRPLETIRGRDAFEVWPEATAERFRLVNEKVLRVNGAVRDVVSTTLPDGSTKRWMAVRFPCPDESGAPGVAGIAFDVGERGEEARDALDDGPLARLSGRERQVLQFVVDGLTSAEVGARLGLSPKSVDTYRSRLMTKLGLADLPSLVKFALRHGLTSKR